MFCTNCGFKIEPDAKFCTSCGTAVESTLESNAVPPVHGQPNQPPPYDQSHYPAYGHGYPPPEKKSGAWWKIAPAIAIAIVLVAAIVVGIFFFISNRSSAASLERAMENLEIEMMERLDKTPFGVLPMMFDAFENGTTKLAFEYEYSSHWWDDHVWVDMTIKSNSDDNEFAVIMDIESYFINMDFDLELYLNEERIAARSRALSDDFFGITFDTLSADIQTFGNFIGLDRTTMNELTLAVEMIEDLMYTEDMTDVFFEEIEKITEDFLRNIDVSTERVRIEVSGETVNATRVHYSVDISDIVDFLRELIFVYEDFYLTQIEIYNNPLTRDLYFEMLREHDFMLDEFEDLIDELEYYGYGEIIFAYYISNNNRLLRMNMEADLTVDGDRGQIIMYLDFGLSVTDRWEFGMSVVTDDGDVDVGLNITWDFYERRGSYVNTINIDVIDNGRSDFSISLSSAWNEASGDFELSAQFADGPFFGGGSLTGNLIMTDTEYTLRFDDFEPNAFTRISFEISGELGAPTIADIDFINLDRWGDVISDMLEDLLLGLFPFF